MDRNPNSTTAKARRGRMAVPMTVALSLVLLAGCAAQKFATLKGTPNNSFSERIKSYTSPRPEPTARTMLVLRRYDLLDLYKKDPCKLCGELRTVFNREPLPDTLYALAELAYLAGQTAELRDRDKKAFELHATTLMHSYLYLFDDRFAHYKNAYDPHFRGACELYNRALEYCLRDVQETGPLTPGTTHTITAANQTMHLQVVCKGHSFKDDDFDKFQFVRDYEVTGLRNHYHGFGLGVPLIAIRKADAKREGDTRYFPPGVSFPVTAFLRIQPSPQGVANEYVGTIELYDPLATTTTIVGNYQVPLESDLTTPLAYYLSQPALSKFDISTLGLFKPDQAKDVQGLYMLEPYKPGKIPVLMVHGLWSSPVTWMEMFNDLRGSPEIRDRYQFWFYLYPTANPFWYTAAQMRHDLQEMRQHLDPAGQTATMDQMVLVGHSMGGLVSKLQTLESRDQFWKTASEQPFTLVKAENGLRQELEETYFFHPNPSVRRVITIATPHRGSKASNDATRYLGSKLIALPKLLTSNRMTLRRENPGVFRAGSPLEYETSIESLSVSSPFLQVMLAAERSPAVKYHNVVGRLPRSGFKGAVSNALREADSDGVVAVTSAHLDDVASEITVAADHVHVHSHPRSVLEVRRILLEHLSEIDNPQRPSQLETPPWIANGNNVNPTQASANEASVMEPLPPAETNAPTTPANQVRWASDAGAVQ